MKKIFIKSFLLCLFSCISTSQFIDAAMYDDEGHRVFGRQNYMRHGTYDPRIPYRQFKEKRVSVQNLIRRSQREKQKYLRCDLPQNEELHYKFNLLRFKQGAHRKCREDIRYIINIPYKTKNKKNLRPYEWTKKGY